MLLTFELNPHATNYAACGTEARIGYKVSTRISLRLPATVCAVILVSMRSQTTISKSGTKYRSTIFSFFWKNCPECTYPGRHRHCGVRTHIHQYEKTYKGVRRHNIGLVSSVSPWAHCEGANATVVHFTSIFCSYKLRFAGITCETIALPITSLRALRKNVLDTTPTSVCRHHIGLSIAFWLPPQSHSPHPQSVTLPPMSLALLQG